MTPSNFSICLLVTALALPAQNRVDREFAVMGTRLTVEIEAPDRQRALLASEAAVRAIEAVEARLSVWRQGSDVTRINCAAPGQRVEVAAETVADLRWAFEFGDRVEGAFDACAGPLILAYRLRGEPRWPDDRTRVAATAAVGRSFFRMDADTDAVAVTRIRRDAAIDCDAFGKGIALDRAGAAAVEAGALRVWFDFGGQVMSCGPNARDADVAIADPRDRARTPSTIAVPAGWSAATSGNGERRLTIDGRSLGHLLDPRTGLPAADFGSVTAVARSAALADAAATALFVLGPERGPAFAARLGVRATFVLHD